MHNRRSRQNAATSCPLRACSEISPRHFWRAFLLRSCCVIGPASPPAGHNATHHLVRTRCASSIADDTEKGDRSFSRNHVHFPADRGEQAVAIAAFGHV